MRAGVAAGHPATADVGAEILADGGTAADAVVAMALASCVAETVMSGLLAGCHAIAFDGSRVRNLDGFAAVPTGSGDLTDLEIPFGDEPVVYAIGPASCAVPGLPAALGELWERLGRLPWSRLCEPALELARAGVPLPEMHARSLADARRALLARAWSRPLHAGRRDARRGRAPRPARPRRRHSRRSPRKARRASIAARSPSRSSRSTESSSTRAISRRIARGGATPSSSRTPVDA